MSRFYWLELRFSYFFLDAIYILFFYYLFFIIYRRNGGYFACKKSLFCSSRELVLCFGVDCLIWEQSFISVNLRKEPLFDSKRTSAFDCEYELILNRIISKLFLRINAGEKMQRK